MQEVTEFTKVQAEDRHGFRQAQFIDGSSCSVFYYRIKRIVDLTIAIPAFILSLPFLVIIAIIIKLDSPGPVLFNQERVGASRKTIGGHPYWMVRTFPFFKFRTMFTDVDSDLHQKYMEAYIAGDEDRMSSIQPDLDDQNSYKLSGDPRVTKFGKFLRRTSLDEMPQLWNVIRGDMSLVGPRPPIPYEVKRYHKKHFRRLATMPGITGLWQVSGRCETTFDEMVRLDLDYIEKQSIWSDLKILVLTIPVVISEKGAG